LLTTGNETSTAQLTRNGYRNLTTTKHFEVQRNVHIISKIVKLHGFNFQCIVSLVYSIVIATSSNNTFANRQSHFNKLFLAHFTITNLLHFLLSLTINVCISAYYLAINVRNAILGLTSVNAYERQL